MLCDDLDRGDSGEIEMLKYYQEAAEVERLLFREAHEFGEG